MTTDLHTRLARISHILSNGGTVATERVIEALEQAQSLTALAQAVIAARDHYGWSPEVDEEINRMRAALAAAPSTSPAAAAVAGEPVASQLADKLQALCDVVHEGRLVPDSDASLGYVHSAVEAAEAALTAYRMAHNAGPELVAVLASIVECHEVESGWVSDAHINAARIAISRATKAAPHHSPSAAEQAAMVGYITEAADQVEQGSCHDMYVRLTIKEARGIVAMLAAAPSASPAEAPAEDAEACELVPSEILGRFPEINPSNYDHDDVCALNAWGIELVKAAHPQPVAPAGQAAAGVQGEDRFTCRECGHGWNAIDETERQRDECPNCGSVPAPAVARGVAEEREGDALTQWQEKCGSCANLSERQGGQVWCCRAVRNAHGAMAAAFYARRGACGPEAKLFAAIPSTAGKEQANPGSLYDLSSPHAGFNAIKRGDPR